MGRTDKQVLGAWGEDQAALYLAREGYEIVERNYLTKRGEIDIIARKRLPEGSTLCFIEVKTRTRGDDSHERATDWQKIKSVVFAARHYCVEKDIDVDRVPIQFEQVSVTYGGDHELPTFRHYEIPLD